jgi:hypothetical protein
MRRSIAAAWIGLSALGLASCGGRDLAIFDDYKLYDLDGSNQAIIGGDGAVRVTDVTAFATRYPLIFIEVGGPNPLGNKCAYKLADASRRSVVYLSPGSHLQLVAVAAIRAQRRGVVSRSCVVGTS